MKIAVQGFKLEGYFKEGLRPYGQGPGVVKPVYKPIIVTLGCFAMLVMSACGRTSTGLVVESVNNYSLRNGPSLNNSVADGDGFIQGMT